MSVIDHKVIVIIDDLDRLTYSEVKEVLFAVKKSFTLPNLTYVLCYDTDNLVALQSDKLGSEKLVEFLEKFINVKFGIYIDSNTLKDYTSRNLKAALSGNSTADPELVERATKGLRSIYDSDEYHKYIPFIGDVRKIKRLINILLFIANRVSSIFTLFLLCFHAFFL